MKKAIPLILLKIFILICLVVCLSVIPLNKCKYDWDSGDYQNLYTVAINSVIWNNGHSFDN